MSRTDLKQDRTIPTREVNSNGDNGAAESNGGSRTRLSWERFNRDAKETIGAGLIPFAVLAQCFQRHWGWWFLGLLLTAPMVILGCATLLVTAMLAAVQTAFFALVRFPSSFVQDLVEQKHNFKNIFEPLEDSYEAGTLILSSGSPQLAVTVTYRNASEDIEQTLYAGWVTPFKMLQSFFKKDTSLPRNLAGVFIAVPLLVINLGTGLFSLVSAGVQFSVLPLRLLSAKIQDFLSPKLPEPEQPNTEQRNDDDDSAQQWQRTSQLLSTEGTALSSHNSFSTTPYRWRQFQCTQEPSVVIQHYSAP